MFTQKTGSVNMFFKQMQLLTTKAAHLNNLQWPRSMSVVAKSLKYTQYGEPADVLQLVEEKLDKPQSDQVLVKILASPINPADINTIQGK